MNNPTEIIGKIFGDMEVVVLETKIANLVFLVILNKMRYIYEVF